MKKLIYLFCISPLLCSAMSMPDLEVDYLYWGIWNNELLWSTLLTPAAGSSYFTRDSFYVCPSWNSGVRGVASMDVWGGVVGLTGRYYYVNHHATGRRVNPGNSTLSIPGRGVITAGAFAIVEHEIPYHSADLFFDWCILGARSARLALQAGGTFAFAKQTTRIRLIAGSSEFVARSRSRFSGGGPRLGLLGEFDVGSNLGLVGELGVAGLIGEQTNVYQFNNFLTSVQETFTLQTGTGVTAHVQMRLAASYRHAFNRACLALNLGWEHRSYFNFSTSVTGLTDDLSGANVPVQDGLIHDLTLGGPYLGISVGF